MRRACSARRTSTLRSGSGALADTDDETVLLGRRPGRAVSTPRPCLRGSHHDPMPPSAPTPRSGWTSTPCPGPAARTGSTGCAASPLVGEDRPLRLEGTSLYLDRYWSAECQVAADLLARADRPVDGVDLAVLRRGLDALF